MSYWNDRQKQLLKQMEKDEVKLKKRLSSFYNTEFRKLDKDIAAYYAKYGEGNVIEYRTMMESLSEDDRKLLMEKMDEFAEKYPQYKDLMPVRTSIYKLNRLEGLQYSILMHQLQIGAVNNEEIEEYLRRQAVKGLNAAAEILGFGKNFYSVNDDIVRNIVGKKWANDTNFSERIWGNTRKLAEYLNTDISQGFARGDSYEKLIDKIRERYNKVNRNDAYRLIYTEGTFVHAESTMKPFEEDFEKYRLSTVGDGKVCPICRGVSEQVFDIKDRQPGVNFPPLHAWCRCTFTVEVDDWDEWLDEYEKRHGSMRNEVFIRNVIPLTQNVHTVKRRMTEQLKNLTGDEIAAVNKYTGVYAQWINRALATGRKIDKYSEEIRHLDSALDKGIATDTIFVQRKTVLENLNAFPKGSKITKDMILNLGDIKLTNKIYTSTSMEPFEWPGRNVTLLLKIPKGTRGVLYIKDIAKDKYKYQEEVLLKRNTKYIIKSIEEAEGGYLMMGEVIE